jgi:hypothetical protein
MSDPDQTLERMRSCLCRWEPVGDARAVFLSCYEMMTRNVLESVAAGEFYDPAWVRHLLVHFAGYYFRALDAYEAGEPSMPAVWACAYRAAARRGAPAVQQLLLGVNAHINYDLIFATADLLADEWEAMSVEDRERRRSDYNHVNDVIGRIINQVQAEIVNRREPVLEIVDVMLGPLDEWLVELEVSRWRDKVWAQALHRVSLSDPVAREQHRDAVEAAAMEWVRRFGG